MSLHLGVVAQAPERPTALAVLDFGNSSFGKLTSQTVIANLKQESSLTIPDGGMVKAAATGGGYTGSLNLSLSEARNLGSVLACDFFILGDAQTLRRSTSSDSFYFDAYASLFVVSARTGRLLSWERPNFQASSPAEAEKSLLAELSSAGARFRILRSINRAREDERNERARTTDEQVPVIEAAPDDSKVAEAEGLRLPRPYRRIVPEYPESAARAEAEATVDVWADLDKTGDVTRVEVARWGGFGLDEETVKTVRQLHFFPAMREGVPIPIRVLLRYNFRKSAK
ncbi:MAG TPA: energy transducer TonB [Pyrinomonadaceae bacterium]|nr:energy transducer TonB [Pyrinomonadaceae bacterium]